MTELQNKDLSKKMRHAKKLLIYPKFQLTLIGLNLVTVLVIAVSLFVTVKQSFESLKSLGQDAGLQANHTYFQFIQFQQDLFAWRLALVIAAIVPISVVLILLLSHRLAGPIVRLREYFKNMSKTGEIANLTFRKGDFFSELPSIIEEGLRSLNKIKK